VTATGEAPAANPERVIHLALLAWGLGYLALGRRSVGLAWLTSEIVAAALVAYLFIGLTDTTWYLIPFVAGVLFLVAWATQAALAYRAALRRLAVAGQSAPWAAAAAMAWLTVPLLVWGTGFWLASGSATSPAAALDRFESSWAALATGGTLDPDLQADSGLTTAARGALGALNRLCAQGSLTSDCSASPRNLVRNVRISLASGGADAATATVTVVSFERRPSQFLGLFAGTELVPVPRQTLLTLRLRAAPRAFPGDLQLGAQSWKIVDGTTP
jgi:hypothetical protein